MSSLSSAAAVGAALVTLIASRRRYRAAEACVDAEPPLPTNIEELTALLQRERVMHTATEKRRRTERTGRRNAEEKLRRAALTETSSLPEARYPILPIATAQSCFMECGGVPRQAGLASATRAVLQFVPNVGPGCFDGLEKHSHIWVVFVFHCNTNAAKIARSHSKKGCSFPSKINPPRLGGIVKVGVLATRTPHRPNPLGLTLCKLEEVDAANRRVIVCGSDLVDGTPILDIKPFIPFADTPRTSEGPVRIPEWTAAVQPLREVTVEALAEEQLASYAVAKALRVFAGDATRLRTALVQALAADVGRRPRAMPYITLFDGVAVHYTVAQDGGATVVQRVEPHDAAKAGGTRPLAEVPAELQHAF